MCFDMSVNTAFNQRHHVVMLLEFYGALLTPKQWDIANAYYRFNLSLQEISEEKNITRAAVNFSLQQTKKKLLYYEEKLNLSAKQQHLLSMINESSLSEKEKKKLTDLLEQ